MPFHDSDFVKKANNVSEELKRLSKDIDCLIPDCDGDYSDPIVNSTASARDYVSAGSELLWAIATVVKDRISQED